MDPTANLAEQRELAAWLIANALTAPERLLQEKSERLAELVEALDDWLTRGGHVPVQWTVYGAPSRRADNQHPPIDKQRSRRERVVDAEDRERANDLVTRAKRGRRGNP